MNFDDMTGRVALALGLIGPAVIGVIAPVVSLLRLHARQERPSVLAAVSALMLWVALCVVTSMLFVQVGFGYAWGWAHSGRPASFTEQLTPLGIFSGLLVLLCGCAAGLHRLIRRHAPVSNPIRSG